MGRRDEAGPGLMCEAFPTGSSHPELMSQCWAFEVKTELPPALRYRAINHKEVYNTL